MRRILCAVLLVAALAGCGDDEGDQGDAGDGATQTPAVSGPELVQIVVVSSAGGEVAPKAYFVEDRQEMKAYVATFEDRDDVAAAIQQAVSDAGERQGKLAVATIAVGCDVPPGVSIITAKGGPEVRPTKIIDPIPECFAPATSLALVEIP